MINHAFRERARALALLRVNYVCMRPPGTRHTYNKYFSFSFFYPVLISKHPPELSFLRNKKSVWDFVDGHLKTRKFITHICLLPSTNIQRTYVCTSKHNVYGQVLVQYYTYAELQRFSRFLPSATRR